MSQDYTIRAFKASDFIDGHGNAWCDVAFEGISEPLKMVVKDPTQFSEGMKVYGNITQETSKAGKAYQRFRREQKDNFQSQSQGSQKPTDAYWAEKQKEIKAEWAIGQAVTAYARQQASDSDPKSSVYEANIESLASKFFAMVDRVKQGQASPVVAETEEKDSWEKRADEQGVTLTDNEYQEQLGAAFDKDGEISLEDIPFN